MVPSNEEQPESEELTLDEAAREFGVSRRTLERLRQQGVLPGVRQGRFLRVRREDVRRGLAFSDPIPLYRELLAADDDVSVEEWMRGWIQLSALSRTTPELRDNQRRWAEEASRRFGAWPVSDYQVRHAIEAAAAAGIDGAAMTLVQAMHGVSPERPVIEFLRELVPMMNPMFSTPQSP